MRSNIEEKLITFLNNKKSIEQSDVVYVLVQLSKYYERERVEDCNSKATIPCIKFFRHWAVHGIIDKESKYKNIVLMKHQELGDNNLYNALFTELLLEIKSTRLIDIPDSLIDSFKECLFQVITDTPVIFTIEKEKLITDGCYIIKRMPVNQ